jgi:formamidopyrimidine-DNA glycosylase
MPELPEVETVRMGLVPVLEGRRFTRVDARRADLRVPFPKGFAKRLTGREIVRLARRAKYLLAELDNGETLIMHLGMSGRFTVYQNGAAFTPGEFMLEAVESEVGSGTHDHVVFETGAARIVYTDHRRFGLMLLAKTAALDQHPLFRGLGPEPLGDDFTPAILGAALKGKSTPIKAALLDQRVVAGLGNIYVCEALFAAGISPKRLASTVAGARAARLVPAIKTVLTEAIAAGGSTLRDYARTDGELGYFQHRFKVYDREGKRCPKPRCGGTIRRIVQSGRSTFFCPKCQR